MLKSTSFYLLLLLVCLLSLSACVEIPATQSISPDKLPVLATTTIVGDVVKNVGGEMIELSVLLPTGVDPHGFEPTPQDVIRIERAKIIFINGAGLETFIDPLLENVGGRSKLVSASEGISLLEHPDYISNLEDTLHSDEEEGEVSDPHTWFDPNNVMTWVDNIETKLKEIDPSHSQIYFENAQQYRQQLETLHTWIEEQVSQLPASKRILVTDHAFLTYFAARYGFQQAGFIIPGYSTLAQPSARELANLEETIRSLGVEAIFVGNSVNQALAERIAKDTGVSLVMLYTGSLSEPDGVAATYQDYMHYNVSAIIEALK